MTYLGGYQKRNCGHFHGEGASGLDLEAVAAAAAVAIFACDDCDRPISFDSYAYHCRIPTKDGICREIKVF